VGSQSGCEVWFCEHFTDLWPVQKADVLVVASEGRVPDLSQECGLVAIRRVNRFDRHPRGVGDLSDRGPPVPVADEQIVRRADDPSPGLRGLFATKRGTVRPLDIWAHWIHTNCIESSQSVSGAKDTWVD